MEAPYINKKETIMMQQNESQTVSLLLVQVGRKKFMDSFFIIGMVRKQPEIQAGVLVHLIQSW